MHDDPPLVYNLASFDSEEVEILLEAYLKDIYSIRTKTSLLQHRIQTSENLIMMKLDYARNYLLALELLFSLVGVALGIAMVVTGIFGMNLRFGFSSSSALFWSVVGCTLGLSAVFIVAGIVYFKHKGLMIVG